MPEIFFIPGLGDQQTVDRQARYVRFLNKYLHKGIFFFDPKWETAEAPEEKLARLRQSYEHAGKPDKVFGVSAGATLSVILGAETNAHLTTVAGKHKGSESIGPAFQRRAPAFLSIVEQSEKLLRSTDSPVSRLTSYHPLHIDGIVPMQDIIIEGAKNRLIPVPFHVPAIIASLAYILTLT